MTAATNETASAFPAPGPCPSWCDGKHGTDPNEWESESRLGRTMVRCHAKTIGAVGTGRERAGVEIVTTTEGERGAPETVTWEPELSVFTESSEAELGVNEALELVMLILQGIAELRIIQSSEKPPEVDVENLGELGGAYHVGLADGRAE